MLTIFEEIAKELIDEASNTTLSRSLSIHFLREIPEASWPIPDNHMQLYLADLASLDLIGISAKNHGVNDTKTYWSFTELGRRVHASIRKNELFKGLGNFEEAPEEAPEETPEEAPEERSEEGSEKDLGAEPL